MNKIEHHLPYDDLDYDELRARMSRFLRRPVGLAFRPPGQGDLPGVIIFEDGVTGDRLSLDPRDVVGVIQWMRTDAEEAARRGAIKKAEEAKPPDITPHAQRRLARFKACENDAARWAIFEEFLTAIADDEAHYAEHAMAAWREQQQQ